MDVEAIKMKYFYNIHLFQLELVRIKVIRINFRFKTVFSKEFVLLSVHLELFKPREALQRTYYLFQQILIAIEIKGVT